MSLRSYTAELLELVVERKLGLFSACATELQMVSGLQHQNMHARHSIANPKLAVYGFSS